MGRKGSKGHVFFTSGETPHYTIMERAFRENWHIYQILLLDTTLFWGNSCDEGSCLHAQVIRYVGTARGIVSQRIRSIPKKRKQKITKGVSHPEEILRCYVASQVTSQQIVRWNRSRKEQR